VKSYHAGDDVYLSGTARQVGSILESVLNSGVRINPSKQGCGKLLGEFLRVAFTRTEARGYLARCVSALVSGNWVSESGLSKAQLASTYARQLWTLMVRSGDRKLGWLLRSSMVRRLPEIEHYIPEICDLRMSVGGSPVIDEVGQSCQLITIEDQNCRADVSGEKASYATDAFLKNYINSELLQAAGITEKSMRRLMLEVSYKPEPRDDSEGDQAVYYVTPVPKRSFYGVSVARQEKVRQITRSETTVAKLLSRLVGGTDWEALVRGIVGDKTVLAARLDKMSYPVTNLGTLGVSELSSLRSRYMRPMRVATQYPVLV
jgi:hypothetical protein